MNDNLIVVNKVDWEDMKKDNASLRARVVELEAAYATSSKFANSEMLKLDTAYNRIAELESVNARVNGENAILADLNTKSADRIAELGRAIDGDRDALEIAVTRISELEAALLHIEAVLTKNNPYVRDELLAYINANDLLPEGRDA